MIFSNLEMKKSRPLVCDLATEKTPMWLGNIKVISLFATLLGPWGGVGSGGLGRLGAGGEAAQAAGK